MAVLALTALIWAGHSIVGRLAVGQIGPMTLTCGRWALALGPILYAARATPRRDIEILRRRWPFVAAMGALGFTAFNALFYVAAHHTSAINISLIQACIPALVLIGARALFGDKVGPLGMLGAAATLAGVGVIAAQGDWSRLATLALNQGDALVLIASVFYAGYTVGLRDRPVAGLGFLAAMAIAALITSIPLFIGEIWRGEFIWPTPTGYALLLYAAIGPAFIAQLLYMRGVQLIGPGRAGVFVNLVPIFGALMAVALLGEPFAAYHVVALMLVVGGIAIAQFGSRPSRQSDATSPRVDAQLRRDR
jgi:drug/metabolite transporter (DMT)-like permease